MKRFLWTIALLWSVLVLPTIAHAQVTRADYDRAAGLRKKYEGLAVNIVDRPTWIGKTKHFWYRKSVKGGNEFVLVDAETLLGVEPPDWNKVEMKKDASAN